MKKTGRMKRICAAGLLFLLLISSVVTSHATFIDAEKLFDQDPEENNLPAESDHGYQMVDVDSIRDCYTSSGINSILMGKRRTLFFDDVMVNLSKTMSKSLTDARLFFILDQIAKIKKDGVSTEEIKELIQFLRDNLGDDSVYLNSFCEVKGIGGGILLPPFLPVSPVLIAAGAVLLDTTGVEGHWCYFVHLAIFIPFIGLPTYILPPPVFIIAGFSAMVIGVVFD